MSPRSRAWMVVFFLCAACGLQAWTSLRTKSLTFDEVTYIPAGYSYVRTGDLRLNPEHPPFTKLLAGLAVSTLEPRLDTAQVSWRTADQWAFGRDFFEHADVSVERIVERARLPFVLLTMLTVVVAFAFGADLYGRRAGLLAAWFSAFDPNLLAHGRLATNDLTLASMVLLTTYSVFRYSRRPTLPSFLLAGCALGLALSTKYIAILLLGLVPLWLVGLAVSADGPSHPAPRWVASMRHPLGRRIVHAMGASAGIVLVGLFVVTLTYLSPANLAPYLAGLRVLYTNVHLDMPAYFHGTFHREGLPYYFLGVFALKAPLALLVLLVTRVAHQIARREVDVPTLGFLLFPAALWLGVISATAMPFGVRYLLPLFPLLFVYVSALAASVASTPLWARAVTGALALWFAASSWAAYPHYLPYFNELAGGPDRGIEWLDDSNVDWGQDLPLLRDYVERERVTDLTVALMAWYDPSIYGIEGRVVDPPVMLALLADPNAPAGTYAVSAHVLTRGRYTPESFDVLTRLEPVAILGHSIYVYRK